jgi:hypothetical protein
MKKLICGILLLHSFSAVRSNNPYRNYLLTHISQPRPTARIANQSSVSSITPIPKYQTPKGAIFCRMEDEVTRATKVWLKIGVQ